MVAPLALLGVSLATKVAGGVVGAVSDALSGGATATTASKTKQEASAQTRKTANDFEKMFLEQTLDRLGQGGGENGPLGQNGEGGGVYRSMLMKEYAGKVQAAGGVGIADQVYRQMLQMQEASRG